MAIEASVRERAFRMLVSTTTLESTDWVSCAAVDRLRALIGPYEVAPVR
jgi:hypothetical protein